MDIHARTTVIGRIAGYLRSTTPLLAACAAVDQAVEVGRLATAARLIAQARWCNLVVSNIPAPQVPLYFAGAPLEASYPAMNLKEDCGMSVACTSAAGTMAFGLTADWDLIPDIEVLARGVESEVDRLAEAAGI